MYITKIVISKKQKVYLYENTENIGILEKETWLCSGIKEGDEISEKKLEELQANSDLSFAKKKALYYLSHRSYCEKELEKKLRRVAGVGKEAAAGAVLRMCELNLVNDEKYARDYAAYLADVKKMAPRAICLTLKEKGVSKDLAEKVSDKLKDTLNPREQLREIILRKYGRNLDNEKGQRRAINGMIRLGYEYGDIKNVLDELIKEINDVE